MNYSCYPKRAIEEFPVTQKSEEETGSLFESNSMTNNTSWFKEGYYRRFQNLKIVLADLNRRKKFAIIEVRDEDYILKTNFYIELRTAKEFYVDKVKYRFSFDNIGNEGRNPFKKAVFFTIERVNAKTR